MTQFHNLVIFHFFIFRTQFSLFTIEINSKYSREISYLAGKPKNLLPKCFISLSFRTKIDMLRYYPQLKFFQNSSLKLKWGK